MNDKPTSKFDIAIVGGGLAGLTAAIRMSQSGRKVVLFEKKDFPRHKVCGEYVSNEVLPILQELGVNPFDSGATRIKKFNLSAPSGKLISAELPLGAFGLSRYRFDQLLADKAISSGVQLHTHTSVSQVEFGNDGFAIKTQEGQFSAEYVIGAFGKTSNFGQRHDQRNSKARSKYVGVKRHLSGDFPSDQVSLHNFKGGYCGVSKVEENRINLCYLALAVDIKKAGGIESFERDVLWSNPHLKEILERSSPLFEQSLAISNFTFGAKKPVVNHVLMAGDAAGMISPLCGNGMAMAITSGFQLAELVEAALAGSLSRSQLELRYARDWKRQFGKRMWWGNRLQPLFGRPMIANTAIAALSLWPSLTPYIIEKTHGEPSLA